MEDYKESINTIIWSLPFKRLGGKTQIYGKGLQDHHRDRLTHTIEVMNLSEQLACKINNCDPKKINIDLCKAIALAHDLGHTPFGHAGEEALHKALSNIKIIGCNSLKGLNGFNHHEQGLDVVTYMYSWDTTNNGEGLFKKNNNNEIGKEICKGILQHTFDLKSSKSKYLSLNYLIDNTKYTEIINKKTKEPSPEAQIVRICDKISYMISDIEDAFIVGAMTIAEMKNRINGEIFEGLIKRNDDLSEHRSFLRYREELIDKLFDDCLDRFKNDSSIDVNKLKNPMNDIYQKIQTDILYENYHIKISNENGKLIARCLFCQYLRNPELIGSQFFRYKYHDQSRSIRYKCFADTLSYYNKIKEYYNFLNNKDVTVVMSKWFKINDCDDSGFEKIIKRNIPDIICVKDWVASLTDSYAERCYHEHVNCWKSKEKWERLNN